MSVGKYRFIGTEGFIGAVRLDRFGQVVELDEAVAKEAIRGNLPILPKEEFDAIGFTDEELIKYAYPGPRAAAPTEFHAKWRQARIALHELRERILAGEGDTEGGEE